MVSWHIFNNTKRTIKKTENTKESKKHVSYHNFNNTNGLYFGIDNGPPTHHCIHCRFWPKKLLLPYTSAARHSEIADTLSGNVITKTSLCKFIENFTSKNWKFLDKNSHIFHTCAQNIDCGGGSNKYSQSMFWAEIRKMYTPVNPSFTIWKCMGIKGGQN